MTDKCFWQLLTCPICGKTIYDNQDSTIVDDPDEVYHDDCLNDNPEFFDPDETVSGEF